MTLLRILVVDDEPVAAHRLAALSRRGAGVETVAVAGGAKAALELASGFKPNVLLLDIEMPGLNGLQLAERLGGGQRPVVIFVTAFGEYAVAAFGLAATDYLLKPVDSARLAEALARARERLKAQSAAEEIWALRATVAAMATATERERSAALWIAKGRVHQRVPIDAIVWVEAERDYVRMHEDRRSHLVRGGVAAILAKLPANRFVRVRRSALVRIDSIDRIERRGERRYFVVLDTGTSIRVGRSYLGVIPSLLELLEGPASRREKMEPPWQR